MGLPRARLLSWRHPSPATKHHRWTAAVLSPLLLGLMPTLSHAQEAPPPLDNAAILQRLDQQAAEIEWLRTHIQQQQPQQPAALEPALPYLEAVPQLGLPAQTISTSNREMEALRQRLETLEQQGDKKKDEKKKEDEWQDISDEKWTVKLGGHMQADYILWPNRDPAITDPSARNYFEFRRLRLLADGTGYGFYDFRIQIDIEPEAEEEVITPVAVIKDAYFTMHEVPVLNQVRLGNFFVPYSLEQVTNDTNNIFLERSIPTQGIFAADREVGVASYMLSEDENKTYTVGLFFDSISEATKERIDSNQGTRFSQRLTYLPYYDEPSQGRYLIHTGIGLLHTEDQDDLVRYRARPQIHEGPRLIDSGNIPSQRNTTANIELATVWGPFSLQSELFTAHVDRTRQDSVQVYGSYIYGSYFVTGENRQYQRFGQHGAQFGRNVPFTNFFLVPGGHGSGALELKARWSYLDLDQLNRGIYNDFTIGFNWYWSDRTRLMFDWIHPITSTQTVFGDTTSDIIGMRFDYNF